MKLRIYNDTLDPNIWDEGLILKPEVSEKLLKVAEDFYKSTDLTGDIQDILFLGSCANYNWTPTSDIDVHVVIDIAGEKINEEYARKFMDTLAFKWNAEHDIEVKGHPTEVYLQDVREPNSTPKTARKGTAIYSLFNGHWIMKPKKEIPQVDANKIRQKFAVIHKKIENLVNTKDVDKLKDLMKSIRNYRNAGLAKGGEFSVENLVFKALRKSEDLKTVKDTINNIYDQQASLPENGNFQEDRPTPLMKEFFALGEDELKEIISIASKSFFKRKA